MFFLLLIQVEGFIAGFFGLFILVVNDAFYLLISNSLMNKLDNGNRQKKASACVSLTVFCFSFNEQLMTAMMGVDQHSFLYVVEPGFFCHEIVLLENVDPDERRWCQGYYYLHVIGSNSLPLQGLILLIELLPI